jgi:hypothetical protein
MRRLLLTVALVATLAMPATASARVRQLAITSPIRHGSYATLTVSVAPTATCSIAVYYRSGKSRAAGLYPKRGGRARGRGRSGRGRLRGAGRSLSPAAGQARSEPRSSSSNA